MSDIAYSLTKASIDLTSDTDTDLFLHIKYIGTKGSSVSEPIKIAVEKQRPNTPTMTLSGTEASPGSDITVTTSSFSSPDETEKHVLTEWRISRDPEGLDIVEVVQKKRDFNANKYSATELIEYLDSLPAETWTDGSQFQNNVPDFDFDYPIANFMALFNSAGAQSYAIQMQAHEAGYVHPTSTDFDINVVRFAPSIITYRATPKPENVEKYNDLGAFRIQMSATIKNKTSNQSTKSAAMVRDAANPSDAAIVFDDLHCVLFRLEPDSSLTWTVVASLKSF